MDALSLKSDLQGCPLIRLYVRVLELLGKEARLGWFLAGANLMLAVAQFAEPVKTLQQHHLK